jgi:hypothetical protein
MYENKELELKLNKSNKICGTVRRELNKKNEQITFYKIMDTPTLTYRSEVWILTKKQQQRT